MNEAGQAEEGNVLSGQRDGVLYERLLRAAALGDELEYGPLSSNNFGKDFDVTPKAGRDGRCRTPDDSSNVPDGWDAEPSTPQQRDDIENPCGRRREVVRSRSQGPRGRVNGRERPSV